MTDEQKQITREYGDNDPSCYRVKPADILLGPEDVPPFSVIRRKGQTDEYGNPQYWHWRLISYVTGIGPVCADRGYNWQELSTDYEINRSLASGKWDPAAWEPCRKEAPMSDLSDLMALERERAKLEAQRDELLAALELFMSWVDNWNPNFTDDPEWAEYESVIRAAIAKAKGGQP